MKTKMKILSLALTSMVSLNSYALPTIGTLKESLIAENLSEGEYEVFYAKDPSSFFTGCSNDIRVEERFRKDYYTTQLFHLYDDGGLKVVYYTDDIGRKSLLGVYDRNDNEIYSFAESCDEKTIGSHIRTSDDFTDTDKETVSTITGQDIKFQKLRPPHIDIQFGNDLTYGQIKEIQEDEYLTLSYNFIAGSPEGITKKEDGVTQSVGLLDSYFNPENLRIETYLLFVLDKKDGSGSDIFQFNENLEFEVFSGLDNLSPYFSCDFFSSTDTIEIRQPTEKLKRLMYPLKRVPVKGLGEVYNSLNVYTAYKYCKGTLIERPDLEELLIFTPKPSHLKLTVKSDFDETQPTVVTEHRVKESNPNGIWMRESKSNGVKHGVTSLYNYSYYPNLNNKNNDESYLKYDMFYNKGNLTGIKTYKYTALGEKRVYNHYIYSGDLLEKIVTYLIDGSIDYERVYGVSNPRVVTSFY